MRSMNRLFIPSVYWELVFIVSFSQSMSGRFKSPASQKVADLCLALVSLISLHNASQPVRSRSGGLYAAASKRGGPLLTFILAKIV